MDSGIAEKIEHSLFVLEKNKTNIAEYFYERECSGMTVKEIEDSIYLKTFLEQPDSKDAFIILHIYNAEFKIDVDFNVFFENDNFKNILHCEHLIILRPGDFFEPEIPASINRLDNAISAIKRKTKIICANVHNMAKIIVREGYLGRIYLTRKQLDEFIKSVYVSCISFTAAPNGIQSFVYLNDTCNRLKKEVGFLTSENDVLELYGWGEPPIIQEDLPPESSEYLIEKEFKKWIQ